MRFNGSDQRLNGKIDGGRGNVPVWSRSGSCMAFSVLFRLFIGCYLLAGAASCAQTGPAGSLPPHDPALSPSPEPTSTLPAPVNPEPTLPVVMEKLIFTYSVDAEGGYGNSYGIDSTIALADSSGTLLITPELFRPFANKVLISHQVFSPSPDGKFLLFDGVLSTPGCTIPDTDCGGALPHLFLADLSTGQARQIPFADDLVYINNYGPPAWSPEGTHFVLTLRKGQQERLFLYDLADGSVQVLTDPPGGGDRYPAWSPDGSWLAFVRWQQRQEQCPEGIARSAGCNLAGLWVINMAGGEARLLLDKVVLEAPLGPGDDFGVFVLPYNAPAWSPDSRRIAVPVAQANEQPDITLVELASGQTTLLAPDLAEDMQPAFSPDGAWISFRSNRSGNEDIFLVRPDGSLLTNLSDHPARDDLAAWSPSGRQLVFLSNRETDFNGFRLYTIPSLPGAQTQAIHLEYRAVNSKPAWWLLP
jgi:Tol biopolymer transport system component